MKQSLKTQDGTRPIQQSLWAGSRKDLVSRIPLPGSDKAKTMIATSGLKCLESFEKFNRPGLLAKMFPALLIGQTGWYSKKCNLIWKLKATKYNRLYFQLLVSVPRIEGTESGLLPTAVASDATTGAIIGKNDKFVITKTGMPRKINQNGTDGSVGLARLGKLGMLPTPTAMAEAEGKMKSTQQKEGSRHSVGLGSAMVMGLLPTPQAIDGCGAGRDLRQKKDSKRDLSKPGSWRGDLKDFAFKGMLPTPRANKVNGCNLNSENLANRGKGNLEESIAQWVVGMLPAPSAQDAKNKTFPQSQQNRDSVPGAIMRQGQTGKSSQLNHRFVMEMMGFPPTWCDIYYEMAEIAIQKKRQRKKPKG